MQTQNRKLKEEFQDLADEFISDYEYEGCACHLHPPCFYCTHEGNPENLANNPEAWEDA